MEDFMQQIVKLNKEGTEQYASFAEQAKSATGGIQTAISNAKTAISRGVAELISKVNEGLQNAGIGSISDIISEKGKNIEKVLKAVAEQIPKIIAVDALPPDMDALQQALNQKRGSEVQLYVPQRGDKAHLVEMAHTNAVERLARESGRYAREEKLLDELAQVLGLSKPPRAIESYDISNWGDGSSVCGMVTFKDGKPFKAGYRKFKMKTVAGTDDYASLAETVSRRAAEYEKYAAQAQNGQPGGNWFGQKPDLLLMDGGRGQVSAARQALAGTALAEVPLFGMVKDDHHRTRAMVDSEGREIAINMNRGTFTFITAIQDETHRFANAYRKQQMKQKSYSSTLTEVPGVGPKLSKALLAQFKSVGAVKEATPDQLENTPGVGKRLAQTIYDYFHTEA